jgi:CheY-like chemotaxis protein
MLADRSFDLIFMDCSMPVMDGYEATRRLRALEGTDKHTTVIALTANAMAGNRERCLAAGMDDFIGKPYDKEQLTGFLECARQRRSRSGDESHTGMA